MATLDRLRDIVKGARPSAVPVVAPEAVAATPAGLPSPGLGHAVPDSERYAAAALELGGALLERSDGQVIIVDREYTAGNPAGID